MTLVCVRIARSDVEVCEHAGGCTIDVGGGVLVRLTAVEQDMIRVAVRPSSGGPRLDRTWMVAPGLPTLPEEGRSKESTEDFAMPLTTLERTADGSVRLSTGRLRVTVPLAVGAPLCLTFGWLDEATGEWRLLLQDRPGGAYYFGASDGRAQHYIVRGRGDAYYGCGERSGALDLSGRRIDMRCVDAMGVREEWQPSARVPGAARCSRAAVLPRLAAPTAPVAPVGSRAHAWRLCTTPDTQHTPWRCAWCAGALTSGAGRPRRWRLRAPCPPIVPPPALPIPQYDAERSDPLYKHWPFYIRKAVPFGSDISGTPTASVPLGPAAHGLPPPLCAPANGGSAAYGVFYDSMARAAFDFGAELNNYFGLFSSYQAECGAATDYYVILGPSVKQVSPHPPRGPWFAPPVRLPAPPRGCHPG
jgi:hypothetical protein